MPAPKSKIRVEFTPVQARTAKIVHATTLSLYGETMCGRKYRGWIVAIRELNCQDCKAALLKASKRPLRGVA